MRCDISSSPSSYASSSSSPKFKTKKLDTYDIIDPSYSRSTTMALHVYVDRNGTPHDPDYRHFPLVTNRQKVRITREEDDDLAVDELFDPIVVRRAQSQGGRSRRSLSPSTTRAPLPRSSLDETRQNPRRYPSQSTSQRYSSYSSPPSSPLPSPYSYLDIDEDAISFDDEEPELSPSSPSSQRPRSQSMKMHWHAFVLSLQFKVFRMKKGMRTRSAAATG